MNQPNHKQHINRLMKGNKNAGRSQWFNPRPRWQIWLEKISLAIERPVNRLIGNPQLNPFYHTGTIALFLLLVVGITGFYIFLFFQNGFDASYNSVLTRIEGAFIARIARAIHRYASGALVITTLLHAFRMLFMDRFRGPRWLAWLTGILMTFILWLAGITGYWLIWDERAKLINEDFADFLTRFTPWGDRFRLWLLQAELNEKSWQVVFIILLVHIALFIVTALFFWFHIRHLNRPRWLPESAWMAGALVALLIMALLFPAGILSPANPNQFPTTVPLDPIFLYYLPLNETGWQNWLWGFMWLMTLVAGLLPWLRRRGKPAQPVVHILDEACTGCTKCANDCPYGAIEMVDRHDDSGHQLLAVANRDKCISCGICVGSCDDFEAIEVGVLDYAGIQNQLLNQLSVSQTNYPDHAIKLIISCRRHAEQGAFPYRNGTTQDSLRIETIMLPCTGAIPPSLLPIALENGATEVEVVGCPPYDCANRMGNFLEEARLTNERVPRLRQRYDHVPITAVWLPPDDFEQALSLTEMPATSPNSAETNGQPDYLSRRAIFQWLSWRHLLVGVLLLGIILIGQIWLTGIQFTPFPKPPAQIQLTLANPSAPILRGQGQTYYNFVERPPNELIPLVLEVDGEQRFRHDYPAESFFIFEAEPVYTELELPAGTHHARLYWVDPTRQMTGLLFDGEFTIRAGQIFRLHDLAEMQNTR